jgi:biopolymer transport protein ExbB/TolQ
VQRDTARCCSWWSWCQTLWSSASTKGVGGVARLRERAVDFDGHRELAQQREQARVFALQEVRLVQRDEDAVRATAHQELAQRRSARRRLKPRLDNEMSKMRMVRSATAITSSIASSDSAIPLIGR